MPSLSKVGVLAALAAPYAAADELPIPAFAWSGSDVFTSQNGQILSSLSASQLEGLVHTLQGQNQDSGAFQSLLKADASPELTMVFVYEKLRPDVVSRLGGAYEEGPAGAFENVKSLLQSSASSLQAPYTFDTDDNVLLKDVQRVTIDKAAAHLKANRELLTNGVPDLLVIDCPVGDDLSASFLEHDDLVGKLSGVVHKATSGNYAAVLTGESSVPTEMRMSFGPNGAHAVRRLGEEVTDPAKEAEEEYQVPITAPILTGLLVGGIFVTIFYCGFQCLFALQTPRKFDDPGKHHEQDHGGHGGH